MAKISKMLGLDWRAQILVVLLVLGGGYLAFNRSWPPFTPANKAKIKSLLQGKIGSDSPSTESEIKTGSPDQGQYVVNPSKPIVNTNPGQLYTAPDENVRKIFNQEVYKQLILPFDQYPHLYGNDYLNQTRGYDVFPYTGAGYGTGDVIPSYRPPLKIGAGQSNSPGTSAIDPTLCQAFYDNYGFYPPGGSCDPYDLFNYFDPYFQYGGQQSGSTYPIGMMGKKSYRTKVAALQSLGIRDKDSSNRVTSMPVYGHRKKKLKSGVEVVGYSGEDVIRERRSII